jgi:hypothetical protein
MPTAQDTLKLDHRLSMTGGRTMPVRVLEPLDSATSPDP